VNVPARNLTVFLDRALSAIRPWLDDDQVVENLCQWPRRSVGRALRSVGHGAARCPSAHRDWQSVISLSASLAIRARASMRNIRFSQRLCRQASGSRASCRRRRREEGPSHSQTGHQRDAARRLSQARFPSIGSRRSRRALYQISTGRCCEHLDAGRIEEFISVWR